MLWLAASCDARGGEDLLGSGEAMKMGLEGTARGMDEGEMREVGGEDETPALTRRGMEDGEGERTGTSATGLEGVTVISGDGARGESSSSTTICGGTTVESSVTGSG